jgi:hypothetical protein
VAANIKKIVSGIFGVQAVIVSPLFIPIFLRYFLIFKVFDINSLFVVYVHLPSSLQEIIQ